MGILLIMNQNLDDFVAMVRIKGVFLMENDFLAREIRSYMREEVLNFTECSYLTMDMSGEATQRNVCVTEAASEIIASFVTWKSFYDVSRSSGLVFGRTATFDC